MTCLVIGLSYGAFIFSTDKYRSSELLISKLNYSIDITEDGSSKSTINGSSVTVPASTKVYLNITLTSVNEIDSKYTLAYKTTSSAKVQYTDRTQWNTQGVIKGIDSNTYSKKIRVVIDNTDISTSSTVNFQVYGGYYWRIIRTNADGGVRLLYHGTSTTATNAYLSSDTPRFNSGFIDSMQVGYMYGTSGSLENNRTNENSSTIKTVIDNWYKDNLNTNYGKYLSTTAVYCNDREIGSGTYSVKADDFNYAA